MNDHDDSDADQDSENVQPATRPKPYAFEIALEEALEPETGGATHPEPASATPRRGQPTDDAFGWVDDNPSHADGVHNTPHPASCACNRCRNADQVSGSAQPQASSEAGSDAQSGSSTATDTESGSSAAGSSAAAAGISALGHAGPLADGLDSLARAREASLTLPDPVQPSFEDAIAPLRPWQRSFVRALRQFGGVVKLACDRANVSRQSAYQWRDKDPAFREAWNDACEDATDLIEAATYRSAVHGDLEPVFQRGICVGYRRRFCPKARELLLKARRPQEFDRGETLLVRGETKVTLVPAAQMAETVSEVTKRLFGAKAALLDAETGRQIP